MQKPPWFLNWSRYVKHLKLNFLKNLIKSCQNDNTTRCNVWFILQACGFEYTSKLQRMFQDIGVSKDLNEQFRRHLNETLSNEPLDIDFQIQVNLSFCVVSLGWVQYSIFRIMLYAAFGNPCIFWFVLQVLSSGSWPFQQSCVFSLPTELERCVHRFTSFYGGQHSGRKLNWLYHMSKGELVTNCFRNR